MINKDIIIKCPNCGAEYLPAEIYYPKRFLGDPKKIIKDATGKILGYDGLNMTLAETFICDKCNKEFRVTSSISFKTSRTDDMFDDDFYVPTKK